MCGETGKERKQKTDDPILPFWKLSLPSVHSKGKHFTCTCVWTYRTHTLEIDHRKSRGGGEARGRFRVMSKRGSIEARRGPSPSRPTPRKALFCALFCTICGLLPNVHATYIRCWGSKPPNQPNCRRICIDKRTQLARKKERNLLLAKWNCRRSNTKLCSRN